MKSFYYEVNLKAGVPSPQPFGGLFFVLWDCGVARQVDLIFTRNSADSKKVPAMTPGFQINAEFDSVTFISSVDTSIKFFASNKPISLGAKDDQKMVVTADEPLPVVFAGTVEPVLGDVKILNSVLDVKLIEPVSIEKNDLTMQAGIVTNLSANVVTQIYSDTNAKQVRIRNVGAYPVAVGGQGLTFESAAIVLNEGDLWIENDACKHPIFAVSQSAAKVTCVGLK